MNRMHSLSGIAIAAALACVAPVALAQAYPGSAPPPQHPQSGAITHTPPSSSPPLYNKHQKQLPAPLPGGKTGLMGAHDMSGTVESVSKDGTVEVHTGEGTLKVHFPDASKHLKKGEKITLHLSYSLPNPPASASSQ